MLQWRNVWLLREGIVGHLTDCGFAGRRKDARPWAEWGARRDQKSHRH